MGIEIKEELLDIEGIKKSNKSLLDLFIRRTAVITSTREDLTEKIIKDQWRQANKKTQSGNDISEIDFCNLGTFFISKAKSRKRIEKLTLINDALTRKEMDEIKKQIIIDRNNNMMRSIKMKLKQLDNEIKC